MPKVRGQIRLLIADDEKLFREALRVLLETDRRFKVVGCADNAAEAVAQAGRLKPDILLLNLAMPPLSGTDVMKEITAASADVRTIVVAGAMTRPEVLTVLQRGARGVVTKDASPALLFKSIQAVMNGQYWVSREALSDMVAVLRDSFPPAPAQSPPRPFKLTRRELQIVGAVVKGCSNKEIASELGVTDHTVKHHLTSIFDKVGVSSRLELALFAVHHGLV